MSAEKIVILNAHQIEQKINRIAYQIYENNVNEQELIIAGIIPNGSVFAQKLAAVLKNISPITISIAEIKLNKKNPLDNNIEVSIESELWKNKAVVIVDDVLNSGKTLVYAVHHFLNQPVKNIQTAVLVDRSHKQFPVKANYVGLSLATTLQEHVQVEFLGNNKDVAYLI
jgi:pyrimidine operon attenuation protein / uracil phosphoribosyltransferase